MNSAAHQCPSVLVPVGKERSQTSSFHLYPILQKAKTQGQKGSVVAGGHGGNKRNDSKGALGELFFWSNRTSVFF